MRITQKLSYKNLTFKYPINFFLVILYKTKSNNNCDLKKKQMFPPKFAI